MVEWRSRNGRGILSAALLALVCAGLCGPLQAQTADKKAAKGGVTASAPVADGAAGTGQSAGQSSEYVGADTCKTCHEDIYKHWENSPHWKTTLDSKGGAAHQGCEGCHGPGGAHVAGGGDVTKIYIFKDHSAKEINNRCLECHAGGTQHMNAINSLHSQNEVSCIVVPFAASCGDQRLSAEESPAGTLLWLPFAAESAVRDAVPSPRERRAGELQRLPQRPWLVETQAGARFEHAEHRLLSVPHGEAGPVRIRASRGEDRRMPIVPRAARRSECPHVESKRREPAVHSVPYQFEF